jgi:enoyl-CoA hydratase
MTGPAGVARITINRPERRNAMSWGVMPACGRPGGQAKADPAVRVLVLTGAGDEAFCAGADLSGMGAIWAATRPTPTTSLSVTRRGAWLAELFEDLWHLGKPTIARVQGWAMAGGFGLALACDLVMASDRARFGAPEINVGLWPYMITVPMHAVDAPQKGPRAHADRPGGGADEAERIGLRDPGRPHDRARRRRGRDMAAILASKPRP